MGNRQDGGNGYSLQEVPIRQTTSATMPNGQDADQEARSLPNTNQEPVRSQQEANLPRPRNDPRTPLPQPRRRRKQLKIVSLNMRGWGSRTQDKWGSINNLMKRHQIGVLGLQETHPCDEMQENIGRRFRNALHIVHTADPDDPSTTGGTSIAIHKGIVDVKNVTHHIVILGRVIIVEIVRNMDFSHFSNL